jgi:type IV secretion system protein VirB6
MATVDYTFLANIFATVDTATTAYIGTTAAAVAADVGPIATKMFTLYLIFYGFAIYFNKTGELIMETAARLIKVGFIMHLAIAIGTYNTLISDTLIGMPDYLMGLVSGSTTTASKTVLDDILSDAINSGTAVWEQGSMLPPDANPGAYFLALIMWISALVCIGYGAFLIILSKVALAVLVGIGPMFIICLMFESTKKFFESWLGQALNYVLISMLTVAVIKLLFGMYANAAQATMTAATTSADFGLLSCVSMLILAVICFLILMQVQTIASSLAGGVSISTMGAINWALNATRNTGHAMRPTTMRNAYRGMRSDLRVTKQAGAKIATPAVWAYRKLRGGNSLAKA